MNDFTKEELQNIYRVLDCPLHDFHVPVNLMSKLESMIDNYKEPCEHKTPELEWKDYNGNKLKLGDILEHPESKDRFVIAYDPEMANSWRAIYENGDNLFLGLQIGDRGQAVKVKK